MNEEVKRETRKYVRKAPPLKLADEGKPKLETPEAPIDLPEETPRNEEAPLETRESLPEETPVEDGPVIEGEVEEEVEEVAEVAELEEIPAPTHFPGVTPDELALLRAQHNH